MKEKNALPKKPIQDRQTVLRALQSSAPVDNSALPHREEKIPVPLQSDSPVPKKQKMRSRTRDHFGLKILPFIVVAILLLLIVVLPQAAFRIKSLQPSAERVATWIHFPAAIVGTDFVPFGEYIKERDYLLHLVNDVKTSQLVSELSGKTVEELALQKVVRDSILERAFNKYDITVSNEELDRIFASTFAALPSSREGSRLTQESFGLSPEEFLSRIMKPYIQKQKLSEKLSTDQSIIQQRQKIANDIRQTLVDVQSAFNEYVAGTREAPSYITAVAYASSYAPATLPEEFAEVKTLAKGGVSSVIDTPEAYVIVVVTDRTTADDPAKEVMRLGVMTVSKPSAEDWLEEQLVERNIFIVSPTYVWRGECQRVLSTKNSCATISTNSEKNVFPDITGVEN